MNFKDGNVHQKIAKRLFPSGITHFILMNNKAQPLNERLIFIDHHDQLNIELAADKQAYNPHDSVAMHITVTDSTGAPVVGNFSLAVTDDAQVKQDALNDENILTRLLLTGDLKGYIEEPGYYLQANNSEALDNLLLTQGWVSYDWLEDKKHPAFAAEDEFKVTGQVQNALNHPIKETKVTLLSKSPLIARDTLTDKEGRFTFRDFPAIDTPTFVLKAVNRHDHSFNVGIVMDDDKPPVFAALTGPAMQPWYISSDTALLNSAKNNRIRIEQKYYDPNTHVLKEVKIIAKKIVKGSQNLNGPGGADQVLDEADMVAARKKNLIDLFYEQVKGFHTGRYNYFYIEDKPVLFIVDGVFLNPWIIRVFSPPTRDEYINAIRDYFRFFNAEDVKGVEAMTTLKYIGDYNRRYVPMAFIWSYTFIEITTRTGAGPQLMAKTPGIYVYLPLALSWPKEFYKPRYAVNDTTKHLPDTRSTIDWEPNIVTDKNGEAVISFFAADKPSTYTVIIEGTDMNGNLGYSNRKLSIGRNTIITKPKSDTK
jgi:hypothetical protein